MRFAARRERQRQLHDLKASEIAFIFSPFYGMMSKTGEEYDMRLDELVNQNYQKLNENDLLIWRYIQEHKKECCSISVEDLAAKCCISRTTISRFTQKLSFDGFREFKMHLKLECETDQVKKEVLLDDICMNYVKCIENARDTDMQEICEHIYHAKRLFVFGTGEAQNTAAKMMRRLFMNAKRFFVTLYGRNELMMALEDAGEEDFVMMISLSGENPLAIEALKKLKGRGTYTVSLTRLSNNTSARLCDKNLYITTDNLMNIGNVSLETSSSYFNVVELLCVKYLMYLEQMEERLNRE